ncbi:5-formyltetrahydrofolate cyclo-ligase [Pararobbsia silviterrae]|uniref:5-formyltetrahydrofolate cyclo-ligase n=1 Tax=Pararobbsia silviterrae TaxID=1792498 RepID=UPI0023E8165A|nr:5-formyltetrahydrofolate cyclo-ligase [Pararobbsia silviterrae]
MAHSIACDPAPAGSKTALRKALLASRQQLVHDPARDARFTDRIVDLLVERAPRCVAIYWPIAGEFDPRPAIERWLAIDTRAQSALPVVVERHAPMVFHAWRPGAPTRRGLFGIPVPEMPIDVEPDLLLIPCVGIDRARFRLGYGGGFYDRTLAAFEARGARRPIAVGVAFDVGRVDTLPREPHDVALDVGVSESGIW